MEASTAPTTAVAPKRARRRGRTRRILGLAIGTWRGKVGLGLTLFVVAVAFLGPLVGGSPLELEGAPFSPAGGEAGPLGGDALGRNVLARTLHGGWRILLVAAAATLLAIAIGAIAGLISAYRGGKTDSFIMRSVDVLLGIPQLVFVLMLLSVIGSKTWLIIVAVGISQAPQVARVLRAAAQNVSERDYVKAVAAWGVPPRTVIRRHVVPSLLSPLMVESALRLSFSIILVSGISFLGLGAHPPTPDWGVMINENRVGIAANAWGVLAPSILLAMLAVGTNMFSDAIARSSLTSGRAGDPSLDLFMTGSTDPNDPQPLQEVPE
jgi:peptide/nickel transport system permease protein